MFNSHSGRQELIISSWIIILIIRKFSRSYLFIYKVEILFNGAELICATSVLLNIYLCLRCVTFIFMVVVIKSSDSFMQQSPLLLYDDDDDNDDYMRIYCTQCYIVYCIRRESWQNDPRGPNDVSHFEILALDLILCLHCTAFTRYASLSIMIINKGSLYNESNGSI